jgi:hypothetical protein
VAPAGISVKELIAEYCGGMPPGHELYAYLPGGASGGILPASLGDIPLDFDTLQPYGCFIGSAAIIVLSQHDRARDAALNMMRFFADESCGQCTPCRVGTAKAVGLMASERWDVTLLDELSRAMADASRTRSPAARASELRTKVPNERHTAQGSADTGPGRFQAERRRGERPAGRDDHPGRRSARGGDPAAVLQARDAAGR